MNSAGPTRPAALPPGTRLLHIGIPKTGTTGLQVTAQHHRDELLAAGVHYPGTGRNHREAISALMGRRWGWLGVGSAVPAMQHWRELMTALEADRARRSWISHEFASEADDKTAARFAEALGPSLHVVITLRPFAAILPSSWQQFIKSGSTHQFDAWLGRVLADPPDRKTTPTFHDRNDQGAVVHRWASVLGPHRVTVVIAERERPQLLTDAFEGLLGLPDGFLAVENVGGLRANRSMSAQESEVIRQLNLLIKGQGMHWRDYEVLVRDGAIARMLDCRTPGADEDRMVLPEWAADRAVRRSAEFVSEIEASGARVIGDLHTLTESPARTDRAAHTRPSAPTQVPLELAVEPLAGLLSATLGRGAFLQPVTEISEQRRATRVLANVRTWHVAGAMVDRMSRRARQRASSLAERLPRRST